MSQQRLCLILFALYSTAAWTENETLIQRPFSIQTDKEVVMAIIPDSGPVELQEKKFAFDWNHHETIADNKLRLLEEEQFLSTIDDISKLTPDDQEALGMLFFKLGAYYIHVLYEPDLAIMKLAMANILLTHVDAKIWSQNHLGYAYAEKYAQQPIKENKERAMYYANKVITTLTPTPHASDKSPAFDKPNEPLAFAYAVKGLMQSNLKQYTRAEKNFRAALALHEKLTDGKDDQYALIKNELADTLLKQSQPTHYSEALSLLKDVKKYWSQKGNLTNDPYAAVNLISLGQAYLKMGKSKAALHEFKTAILIYKNFYGEKSILLTKPYQLLAKAYKSLGNVNRAAAYEHKANALRNA